MSRGWNFGQRALSTFSIIVLAFLIVPILVIVPISFNSGAYFRFPPEGYSLRWYSAFWSDPEWLVALGRSFAISAGAAALATIFGTLAAFALRRVHPATGGVLLAIFIAPLIVPVVVLAAGAYFMLSAFGLIGTYAGMVALHAVLGIPFVVLVVSAALKRFDPSLERAAQISGSGPVRVLTRVTIPILAPAIVTGALFAFVTSFDEVVVGLFIAGPHWRTLPIKLFLGIQLEVTPLITVVASLMIFFTVAVIIGAAGVSRMRKV